MPTCALHETIGEIRRRVEAAEWDTCVVVNDAGVVLGLLRGRELAGPPDAGAEEVMRPGPSTFRPHVPIGEMADYLSRHDLDRAPVTTSDGRLVGLLLRDDAVREAKEADASSG